MHSFDAFLDPEFMKDGHFPWDCLVVIERMQTPHIYIVGMYEKVLEQLDPWVTKKEDWQSLSTIKDLNLDNACYISALQIVGVERFRQKRGVEREASIHTTQPLIRSPDMPSVSYWRGEGHRPSWKGCLLDDQGWRFLLQECQGSPRPTEEIVLFACWCHHLPVELM